MTREAELLEKYPEIFRAKYDIPVDVTIRMPKEDEFLRTDDDGCLIFPLFAITKYGVRFPIHPLLIQFCVHYNLPPS